MKCRKCGGKTRTPDTREVEGGAKVVRIRRCTSSRCGWSEPTIEIYLEACPAVAVERGAARHLPPRP